MGALHLSKWPGRIQAVRSSIRTFWRWSFHLPTLMACLPTPPFFMFPPPTCPAFFGSFTLHSNRAASFSVRIRGVRTKKVGTVRGTVPTTIWLDLLRFVNQPDSNLWTTIIVRRADRGMNNHGSPLSGENPHPELREGHCAEPRCEHRPLNALSTGPCRAGKHGGAKP